MVCKYNKARDLFLVTVSLHGVDNHLKFARGLKNVALGFVKVLKVHVEVFFLGQDLLLEVRELADALVGQFEQAYNVFGRFYVFIIASS